MSGISSRPNSEICVPVFNDDIPEPDEMFIGWLSNPVDAVLGNNMAWGTIVDRDPPILTVSDASASESDAAVEFTLRLHAPDLDPSSVDYTTVVRTSEGDAAARPGDDFTTALGHPRHSRGRHHRHHLGAHYRRHRRRGRRDVSAVAHRPQKP